MRVLVVGAASWDTVLHVDRWPEPRPHTVFAERSYETLGSTGAGKAVNLARLGHEVHLHTLLGDDAAGERVCDHLVRAGVHLHVDPDAVGTEQHVNLMTPDGGRLSLYRSVARPRDDLDLRPVVELAATCDAVVLNITDYVRRLVAPLAQRGVGFWTDLHDWDGEDDHHRDFLAAHAITFSADRLGEGAGALGRRLAGDGRLVACTRGAAGVTAWHGDRTYDVPVRARTDVVDTNGAGDAFFAGLLHGMHEGWPLERALAAGTVAGGEAVTGTDLAGDHLSAALLAERTRG